MQKFFGSNFFFIGPQECFAVCYAQPTTLGLQFFLLSPEAYLLTGEKAPTNPSLRGTKQSLHQTFNQR